MRVALPPGRRARPPERAAGGVPGARGIGLRRRDPRDPRDPVTVGELLSTALPGAFLGRLLDLELLREVWRDALAPEFPDLADAAFPVAFDRGVVTLRARDRKAAAALARARKPLCRALLTACRLPGAPLRLRVVFPQKRSSAAPGREAPAGRSSVRGSLRDG